MSGKAGIICVMGLFVVVGALAQQGQMRWEIWQEHEDQRIMFSRNQLVEIPPDLVVFIDRIGPAEKYNLNDLAVARIKENCALYLKMSGINCQFVEMSNVPEVRSKLSEEIAPVCMTLEFNAWYAEDNETVVASCTLTIEEKAVIERTGIPVWHPSWEYAARVSSSSESNAIYLFIQASDHALKKLASEVLTVKESPEAYRYISRIGESKGVKLKTPE